MHRYCGFNLKRFPRFCSFRARFVKKLCVLMTFLGFLASSLMLMSQRHNELHIYNKTNHSEREVEEWTTDDDGTQEWVVDRVARQDRAIVYIAHCSRLDELAKSAEFLFRAFNDKFRYRYSTYLLAKISNSLIHQI